MPLPSLRSMRQAPTTSLLAILALALGLGAGAALFSLLDGLLLHPVPFPRPQELVTVWRTHPDYRHGQFSGYQFNLLAAFPGPFEAVATVGIGDVVLQGSEGPIPLHGARVSGQLFPLLQVKPALGRTAFSPEEDRLGGPGVVILSDALWRTRFGGDPAVLGRNLLVAGRSCAVVGVLPRGFRSITARLGEPELYLPIGFRPDELLPDAGADYEVLARLKPGVSVSQATAALHSLCAALPAKNGLEVSALSGELAKPYRARLGLLAAAVGLLLAAACANAANLMLARFTERRGILALESILGASPTRLAGQVVAEGLTFGLAGAVLGLALEVPLRTFLAAQLGLAEAPGRPGWVIPVALGLGLLSGLAASLLPAWHSAHSSPLAALQDLGTRASLRTGPRRAVIALELALSFILLAGSGALLQSLWAQLRQGPGFDTRHLYICAVPLPQERQAMASPWARELALKLRQTPGMEGACVGLATPIFNAGGDDFTHAEGGQTRTNVWHHRMEGNVAEALGMRLLEGRCLRPGEAGAVVISRPLAQTLWPDGTALGRRLEAIEGYQTVVGVVAGTREYGLEEPIRRQIFERIPPGAELPELDLILRSRASAATVREQVRAALATLDSHLASWEPLPFEQAVTLATQNQRRAVYPLALYGLLSQLFRSRRKELGIRSALGAPPLALAGLVLATGFRLLLEGLAGGLLGALVLARVMAHALVGSMGLDAASLGVAGAFLALAAGLACAGPACIAAFSVPAVSLRE